MNSRKKEIIIVLIILVLSLISHFIFFSKPNSTVFDEVHFGKFVSGYLNHQYFFDIHPPLAKLAISFVAWLGGFKTGFAFKDIGDVYPDNSYIWLRLLPSIAGTLLPLIIFYLARAIRFSLTAATAAALFIILENALLGQSLFILLDSMLLLFGLMGLLFYVLSRRYNSMLLYFLAFFSLALSISIKWTGLGFLALAVGAEVFDYIDRRVTHLEVKNFWPRLLILLFLPLIIYFSIFSLHFSILGRSGEGDAFMSSEFQKTLSGNQYQTDPNIKPANIFWKFAELNIEMYRANQRIEDNHPYTSKWYTWPMMARPIYYWNKIDDTNKTEAKIYLFGNPIIFWAALLGLVTLILECFFFPGIFRRNYRLIIFLLVGFIINFIPFIFIKRPMFLYHYFPALIFAILSLCFVIDQYKNQRNKKIIFAILLALALASFIFYAPLTYGINMSQEAFKWRLFSNNWQ